MKKKKVLTILFLSALTVFTALPAYAGQWQKGSGKNKNKWWYNHMDGSYPKSTWAWIDGNGDGYAECYYFDKQGWLQTKKTIDGYTVDSTGAWLENGVVKLKSTSESGVFTNGKNENSTGTVEMEGDLNLGTEVSEKKESALTYPENAVLSKGKKESSQKENKNTEKKDGSDIVDITDSFGDPSMDVISAALQSNKDMGDLISYARSFIAVLPYRTAGTSLSSGVDCSGFTQQVFKHFGISIPRDSRSQYAEAIKISEADLQPGDLIFYGSSPSTIYHVGIYSGNGTIIHATRTGDFVREHDYHYAKAYGFGRYIRK